MEQRVIDPADVVQFSQIPERPEWYALGLFERRVTLRSQQVRALNLIYSLLAQKKLRRNDLVAVIGAGAAGLTAAAAALRKGCRVEIFESSSRPLPLQQGNLHRWIHPNIYDWPYPGSQNTNAGLPLLNWNAGSAGAVAKQIIKGWQEMPEVKSRKVKTHFDVNKIELFPFCGGRSKLTYDKDGHRDGQFDIVIFAVGFGVEGGHLQYPAKSYWREDDLHQPMPTTNGRTRILISGSGDGGLIDLLRSSIEEFQHDKIVGICFGSKDSRRLESRLIAIEDEARNRVDGDEWMYEKYKQLPVPKAVAVAIQKSVRKDTEVTLNSKGHIPFSLNSSILNRFLASRMFNHGVKYQHGNIAEVTPKSNGRFQVRFDRINGTQVEEEYDRLVIRHGPTSALEKYFPSINALCGPLKLKAELDQSRYPIWSDGFYSIAAVEDKHAGIGEALPRSSSHYGDQGSTLTETGLAAFQFDLKGDFQGMTREQLLQVIAELIKRGGGDGPPRIIRTEE